MHARTQIETVILCWRNATTFLRQEEERRRRRRRRKTKTKTKQRGTEWLVNSDEEAGRWQCSQPASQCHASKVARLFAGYTGHGNFMNEHMSAITVCVCVCVIVFLCAYAYGRGIRPQTPEKRARERERPHTHKNSQVSILRLWATGSSTKAPKGRASK